MSIYLEDHPPARAQYRAERKAWGGSDRRHGPSGAIVLHTPENITDLQPPDHGAENVAAFIAGRTDAAGSYHSVSDSDSTVHVGRYSWQMFGEGTGGNRWALHLACACKAAQWDHLPPWWVQGTIRNAATEARRMADWVERKTGVVVPPRRINEAQYRRGEPGFIAHGDIDPDNRTDPGEAFPWDQFLRQYAGAASDPFDYLADLPYGEQVEQLAVMLQALLESEGVDIGRSGPAGNGVDGDPGPRTLRGAVMTMTRLLAKIGSLEHRIDDLLADDAGDATDAELFRLIQAPLFAALRDHQSLATELEAVRAIMEPTE